MAFSTRRGGWANSLLPSYSSPAASSSPSSTSKSKVFRKPRRRLAVKDFLFRNFFAIGLSVTLVFFFIVVLRHGIPSPIASGTRSRSSARTSRNRKPIHRRNASADSGSAVDITTKGLYDKIDFSDVDGGAWKQGWPVSYKGNEWDSEKLKIFVVPHSHNDPGWKLTVEEYYNRQSRHILDTIVDTLSKVHKISPFRNCVKL